LEESSSDELSFFEFLKISKDKSFVNSNQSNDSEELSLSEFLKTSKPKKISGNNSSSIEESEEKSSILSKLGKKNQNITNK
jgi:hypothetical protein